MPADPGASSGAQRLSIIATIVALVLILAYLVAVYLVWSTVKEAKEGEWLRYADLRGGLEALAFAAAGALLGTTVQRQATQAAEKKADEEKTRADANQQAAEGGRALAANIRSRSAGADDAVPAGPTVDAGTLDSIARQYGL
ncbi:MAG: hypothetical protein QOE42_607 [Chloroflexota bacterium]|jgi:hypothetical protein|nr:hypothetical protein [Chloroflexota bacterium]